MHVKGLMFDPYNNSYIVVLRDEEHSDMLPIWVGKSEAGSISMALENVTPPRPMTHDFMKSFLDAYNAKVISVVITDLSEHTYFAKIHLMYEDSEYTVDARPSDAIALALRRMPQCLQMIRSSPSRAPKNSNSGWKISSRKISANSTPESARHNNERRGSPQRTRPR